VLVDDNMKQVAIIRHEDPVPSRGRASLTRESSETSQTSLDCLTSQNRHVLTQLTRNPTSEIQKRKRP